MTDNNNDFLLKFVLHLPQDSGFPVSSITSQVILVKEVSLSNAKVKLVKLVTSHSNIIIEDEHNTVWHIPEDIFSRSIVKIM